VIASRARHGAGLGRRAALRCGAAALACAGVVAAPVALASPGSTTVAPQDSFTGRITGGTGAWHGASGRVSIQILDYPSPSSTRVIGLAFDGKPCRGGTGCVRLGGRLTGSLTPGPKQLPDAGDVFEVTAHGTLKPLGSTHAHGSVHGTGFIAKGQEGMHLTLRGGGGSMTISADSATVPGFTNP
jgi:hypothetical protein